MVSNEKLRLLCASWTSYCLDILELEDPSFPFKPEPDRRPSMPEPLPVRLVAVADVTLPTMAGIDDKLDAFYVELLGFGRSEDRNQIVYHADNHDLRFQVVAELPVPHPTMRPTGIAVPLLSETIARLLAAEIEYTHQRGMFVGMESLLLLDPAGNWIEITDMRAVA